MIQWYTFFYNTPKTQHTISMVQSTLIIFNYVCLVYVSSFPSTAPAKISIFFFSNFLLTSGGGGGVGEKVNACVIVLFIHYKHAYNSAHTHTRTLELWVCCLSVCIVIKARTIRKICLLSTYKKDTHTHSLIHTSKKRVSVLYKYITLNEYYTYALCVDFCHTHTVYLSCDRFTNMI